MWNELIFLNLIFYWAGFHAIETARDQMDNGNWTTLACKHGPFQNSVVLLARHWEAFFVAAYAGSVLWIERSFSRIINVAPFEISFKKLQLFLRPATPKVIYIGSLPLQLSFLSDSYVAQYSLIIHYEAGSCGEFTLLIGNTLLFCYRCFVRGDFSLSLNGNKMKKI